MAFRVKGELVETCSCNMLCPCWYGVQELMIMDQGWCATPLLARIDEGDSDGIDIGGQNVVLATFFPGPTLFDGNGTGRVYVDDRSTEDQEREFEKIFQAREGGPMEAIAALVTTWLPTKRGRIEVSDQNGDIHATVDGVGEIFSKRLVNDQGDRMTMRNTFFAMGLGFLDNTAELAPSASSWNDPDMPLPWETKSGAAGKIDWDIG